MSIYIEEDYEDKLWDAVAEIYWTYTAKKADRGFRNEKLKSQFTITSKSKPTNSEYKFAEWASHSDWVYIPSKNLWYNEENEENITPKTTQQLVQQFQKEIH